MSRERKSCTEEALSVQLPRPAAAVIAPIALRVRNKKQDQNQKSHRGRMTKTKAKQSPRKRRGGWGRRRSYSASRGAVVINDAVFVAAGAARADEQGFAVSALCFLHAREGQFKSIKTAFARKNDESRSGRGTAIVDAHVQSDRSQSIRASRQSGKTQKSCQLLRTSGLSLDIPLSAWGRDHERAFSVPFFLLVGLLFPGEDVVGISLDAASSSSPHTSAPGP